MQLVHAHARCDRAQRVDEFAFDQVLEHFGLHRALAKRLRGHRDRSGIGADADIELGLHIDPQAVERDQRLTVPPDYRQHQRVHIDRHGLVENGQHQCAAVHDDLFAADAGPHEGDLLRRAPVQARYRECDDEENGKAASAPDYDFRQVFHWFSSVMNCGSW